MKENSQVGHQKPLSCILIPALGRSQRQENLCSRPAPSTEQVQGKEGGREGRREESPCLARGPSSFAFLLVLEHFLSVIRISTASHRLILSLWRWASSSLDTFSPWVVSQPCFASPQHLCYLSNQLMYYNVWAVMGFRMSVSSYLRQSEMRDVPVFPNHRFSSLLDSSHKQSLPP